MSALINRIDSKAQADLLAGIELPKRDKDALGRCLMRSDLTWIGKIDGEYACVWGLIPPSLMSDQAYLWLFSWPIIEDHKFLFIRHSQLVMQEMLGVYSRITGHASVDATRSIRWLKWLGAEFGEPVGRFVPFVIRKKHG